MVSVQTLMPRLRTVGGASLAIVCRWAGAEPAGLQEWSLRQPAGGLQLTQVSAEASEWPELRSELPGAVGAEAAPREAFLAPGARLFEVRPLEPLQWIPAPPTPLGEQRLPVGQPQRISAELMQLPRINRDQSLAPVEPRRCTPQCDAEHGVCAMVRRFAWSAGGIPECICSERWSGPTCSNPSGASSTPAAHPGTRALVAQGLARVGSLLEPRAPFEVAIGTHMRDLAAVWVLAAAATAALFALAACWLRRSTAKGSMGGPRVPAQPLVKPEVPCANDEEWVRTSARRSLTRSNIGKVPQIFKDDSDEGELDS